MSVRFDGRYSAGDFTLDAALRVGSGLTALVGPSGSGKTTLLHLLAGVLRPDKGTIYVGDQLVVDTATRTWVPPHRRPVGYVFQEPRLFPHMTVRQNLGYGRWFRSGEADDGSETEVVALLNLASLLTRRPSRLSGGEKQRVALGRALLARPRLLLFDEPLASIDQAHREEILPFLDRVRRERSLPTVYVTHSWNEVAGRASDVVQLANGKVVYNGPATDFQQTATSV